MADAKVGKPKVGGPFALKDQDGNTFTDKDLLGKFSLVYVSFFYHWPSAFVAGSLAHSFDVSGCSSDSPTARTSVRRSWIR